MGAWIKSSGTGREPYWRIYDPIADGKIFTNSEWHEQVLAPFAKLVNNKKYVKTDYETWREFKKEYDYWVVYFGISTKEPYYPNDVIIEAYTHLSAFQKLLTRQNRTVYHINIDERNTFGKYLVKNYFHNSFYFHDLDAMGNSMKYDKEFNCGSQDEDETYKIHQTVGARILYYQLFPKERNNMNTTATTANTITTNYAYNTNTDWAKVNTSDLITGHTINDGSISISTDTYAKQEQVNKIDDRLNVLEKTLKEQTNNKKEDKKMKMFNFDFGPIKDNDNIRMSPYGLAVKNVNGTYQAYDKKNGEMMDVDVFNFKADNMFFKMPVALDAVGVGDLIIFNRKPCFVFGFSEQGDVIVIDIALGEKKTILPSRSPFGFNYITKVVSFVDNMFGGEAPSAENPFGNILPFMMMSEDNSSMKDMLPMMMLMNNSDANNINPLMFYFMNKDSNSDNDWLPFLLLMNNK